MRRSIPSYILLILSLIGLETQAQLIDNFDQYSWEQKDSIIETLYRGGAHHVVTVMINQAHDEETAKTNPQPEALAAFNMWQGVRFLAENNLEEAVNYLQQSINIYEGNPSIPPKRYQDALLNLSDIYLEVGDPVSSLDNLKKVIKVMEADTSVGLNNFFNALLHVTDVSMQVGDLALAEQYGRDALSLSQNRSGNESDEYFQALAKLGEVYLAKGEIRRASNLILQANNLAKTYLAKNHFNRVYYGNKAAEVLTSLGRYTAAEQAYEELLEFYDAYPSNQDDISYPMVLDKMGSFYQAQGDLDEAYSYFDKANILFELRTENTDPRYIQSQTNVGNILRLQGKQIEAELYYLAALQYTIETYGEESWSEGYLRDHLASMYMEMGKYESSLEQRLKANKIIEANLGPNDPEYAVSSLNIGQTYLTMGRDSLARDYMTTAYIKLEQIYGANHIRVYTAAYNLAQYYSKHDIDIALDYFMRAGEFVSFHLNHISPLMPMADRENMKIRFRRFLGQYLSLAYENKDQHRAGINQVQNFVLSVKLSEDHPDLVTMMGLLKNPSMEIRRSFVEWQRLRTQILSAEDKTIVERKETGEDLDAMITQLHKIEQELIPAYASSVYQVNYDQLDISQLKAKLNSGEALVDMIRVDWYDLALDSFLNNHTYLAFITGATSSYTEAVKIELNKNVLDINQVRNQTGYTEQIWSPLSAHLQEYDKVYFAPDGFLFKVAYGAMATEGGKLVWDLLDHVSLTSPLDLLRLRSSESIKPETIFMGGPELSRSAHDSAGGSFNDFRVPPEYIAAEGDRSSVQISNAVGATQEVTQLATIFEKKKRSVRVIKDGDVHKAKFYQSVAGAPGILHLNIPGFFLDPDGISQDTSSVGLLASRWLKSGLALSGAKDSWGSDTILGGQPDDGLVTSLELSAIDFSGIDLLVLSGFNLEQKYSTAGDSFNRLIRTLKLAGAEKILVSMWPTTLEDRMTFFELFYKNILKNNNPKEALDRTQKKLRKKIDPRIWAGYTLI